MSLYQKYRPKTLSDLVGQKFVRDTLSAALKKNETVHSYLFFGSRGTGKTSTARILAKALNCDSASTRGDPCNTCEMCQLADSDSCVDLIEIDGASNRKIEHARSLIDKIHFSPTLGKKKVYIIDEVHMLTKEAFNALLKTLEEPPDHAHFLLATTELQKVPETIRSRCQTFSFHRFTDNQIADRLQEIADTEKIEVSSRDVLLMIAKKSTGGLRDAIGLFEQLASSDNLSVDHMHQELGMVSDTFLADFFLGLSSGDISVCFALLEQMQSEGMSLDMFLEAFLEYLRVQMLRSAVERPHAENLDFVLQSIANFENARRGMKDAFLPLFIVEIAVVQSVRGILVFPDLPQQKETGSTPPSKKNTSTQKEGIEEEKQKIILRENEQKPQKKATQQQEKEEQETKSMKNIEKNKKDLPLSPQKSEEEKGETSSAPLSDQEIHQRWKKMMGTIPDVILRVALSQSHVSMNNPHQLQISFTSESFCKQAQEKKRFEMLLSAVRTHFGEETEALFHTQSIMLEKIPTPQKQQPPPDTNTVTDPIEVAKFFG